MGSSGSRHFTTSKRHRGRTFSRLGNLPSASIFSHTYKRSVRFLDQQIVRLLTCSCRIFSLLHHRQPFDTVLKTAVVPAHKGTPKSPPSIADKMSIGGVLSQPPEPPKVYMKTDYFALFTPLLKYVSESAWRVQ